MRNSYRRRRYPRRLRNFRNPFQGVRRTGRRGRRMRIMRQALVRRPLRPEVKYVDVSATNLVAAGGNSTFAVSPTVVTTGTGEGQRVGSELKIRYLRTNFYLSGSNFPATTGNDPDQYVRFILWTPRIDYDVASPIMAAISYQQQVDYNVATVVKDFFVHLGNRTTTYSAIGVITGVVPPGAVPYTKQYTFHLPFPRTARFPPSGTGINALDEDKDILYCTLVNGNSTLGNSIQYAYNTRMTYVDN